MAASSQAEELEPLNSRLERKQGDGFEAQTRSRWG